MVAGDFIFHQRTVDTVDLSVFCSGSIFGGLFFCLAALLSFSWNTWPRRGFVGVENKRDYIYLGLFGDSGVCLSLTYGGRGCHDRSFLCGNRAVRRCACQQPMLQFSTSKDAPSTPTHRASQTHERPFCPPPYC